MNMKHFMKRILGEQTYLSFSTRLRSGLRMNAKRIYSEFGEDVVLENIFRGRDLGFYVDVGAHHPFRQSNTYFLYKKGWRGINIDASPISVNLLRRFRKRDVNIQSLVSDEEKEITFYSFGFSDMNTADPARAEEVRKRTGTNWKTSVCRSQTLSSILEKHVPPQTQIDLLSVDAEGSDLAVIKSNDWTKFYPTLIFVEYHFSNIESLLSSDLHRFLHSQNYDLVNILGPTLVYIAKSARNYDVWPFLKN